MAKTELIYKGRPFIRKDNLIYYGSMGDKYIAVMQILETKKVKDMDVATKVTLQLQLTDPNARPREKIVKQTEKSGLYAAVDVASVWLERAMRNA